VNIVPLMLLWAFTKFGGDKHGPSWPTPKHPPPRHPQRRRKHARHGVPRVPHVPPMPHHDRTHEHAERHPAVHHAPGMIPHMPHVEMKPPAEHEDHTLVHHAPVHHVQPHVVHHTHHDVNHGTAEPTPLHELHQDPPAPPDATPEVPAFQVSQVQAVLRGLGWKGAGTMKGPLSSDLTDGLYGPVTAGDWAQSARKRGLNPVAERLGPTTMHVDPGTYAALKSVAQQSGAVVGIGGGRAIRIP